MDRELPVLLDYPTERTDRASVAADAAAELAPLTSWWSEAPLVEVQRRYVGDFDLAGPAALYLTYHRFGDDRLRGRALVAFTRMLRGAGWELDHWELPDYLPVVLEFAAVEPGAGLPLLREYRAEVEQIAAALHRATSPWACALDRVLEQVGRAELVA